MSHAGFVASPAPEPVEATTGSGWFRPPMKLRRLDRYLLVRAVPPMLAVLGSTMVAFLMERLLRSFDLLAQTNRGFSFLLQLAANLTPHYLGLVLPGGFFIGLYVVVNRLNRDSEIDAILAGGISLARMTVPFVGLGLILMVLSLVLYGFIQPYSRYAYLGVIHAAQNAGWNGEVRPQAILSPSPDLTLTAEDVAPSGERLERVFIRRRTADAGDSVITAARAEMRRNLDNSSVTLELHDGQQLLTSPQSETRLLSFSLLTIRVPLAPTAKLLRARGGEESELTLFELVQQGFSRDPPPLPRQAVLAELYSRLARALALPFMPLLAVPFGLTAKRAGSAPGIALAGLLLFAFQGSLIFTQGLAADGQVSAAAAQGWPTLAFLGACIGAFALSRKRPGENPITWFAEVVADAIAALIRRVRGPGPLDNR